MAPPGCPNRTSTPSRSRLSQMTCEPLSFKAASSYSDFLLPRKRWKSRQAHKISPAQLGTGLPIFPRYHPIYPPQADLSSRTPSCPVVTNGRRTRPGLLTRFSNRVSAGGSGGIFSKVGAPALTGPGSLSALAYLLVSITAFTSGKVPHCWVSVNVGVRVYLTRFDGNR
jgi:hypothetical protein